MSAQRPPNAAGDTTAAGGPRLRSRRLFFALWPDAALRTAVVEWTRVWLPAGGGRPQRPEQVHVTLVFLGSVPEVQLADVRAAGGAVTGSTFTVLFDRIEHWRKARVLCLAASVTPPALVQLVASLNAAVAALRLPSDDRPYQPHVTLARGVARFDAPPKPEALAWHAASFALIESRTDPAGARYEPLASWPLDAAQR